MEITITEHDARRILAERGHTAATIIPIEDICGEGPVELNDNITLENGKDGDFTLKFHVERRAGTGLRVTVEPEIGGHQVDIEITDLSTGEDVFVGDGSYWESEGAWSDINAYDHGILELITLATDPKTENPIDFPDGPLPDEDEADESGQYDLLNRIFCLAFEYDDGHVFDTIEDVIRLAQEGRGVRWL